MPTVGRRYVSRAKEQDVSAIDDAKTDDGNHEADDASAAGGAEAGPDGGLLKALQAERAKRQMIADELAAIKAAQDEAERKAAEDAGKHEELYKAERERAERLAAENEQFKAERDARLEQVRARNDERLGGLPDALKKAAQVVADKLTPDDLAAYLDSLPTEATQYAAGTRASRGKKAGPPPECVADAKRVGKTGEEWFPIWITLERSKRWRESTNYTP